MDSLDRNQPYAEFWPPQGDAFYEQNGLRYDAHGRILPGQSVPERAQQKARKPEPKPAAEQKAESGLLELAADNAQLRSQLVE